MCICVYVSAVVVQPKLAMLGVGVSDGGAVRFCRLDFVAICLATRRDGYIYMCVC
jgi:hypothetical protein